MCNVFFNCLIYRTNFQCVYIILESIFHAVPESPAISDVMFVPHYNATSNKLMELDIEFIDVVRYIPSLPMTLRHSVTDKLP